ncbi:unnamed protein product [Alopecurus aequalis]
MDMAAFYFQAAEAAATVAVGAVGEAQDVEAPTKLPSRTAVLLKIDVQQTVGLPAAGDAAAAHGTKTLSLGAVAVGMMDNEGARAFQGGGHDFVCPECGKAFPSGKAMYGHLRAHPERRYKGASRPATPVTSASAAAGESRPKKAPSRKEVPELTAMKWPVTARRSRTPVIVSRPVSAEPAAVLLLEPPSSADSAPLLLEPPRGVEVEPVPLQMELPPSVEPPVLLLEPPRSEEAEAAMTLLELYDQMRGVAPPEQEDQLPTQQMHVEDNAVVGQQIPQAYQLELPADHVAPLRATEHAPPVEHIFGIIVEPQAPDVEQSDVTAASKGKMPMEPELVVNSGALVLFRDKHVSPGPSKRPKKRPLQDPDQTQSPDAADGAEEDRLPPLKRIPSPASDRRFMCPVAMCSKTFPTHQALGGHMASHNRAIRCAATPHMDGLAAAHAVHNIMVHHKLRQDAALVEEVVPPVPKAPKTHSCSRCDLIFPTGQALGGHMRKHWIEENLRAAAATAVGVPTLDAVAPAAVPSARINSLALVVPAAVPAAPANAMTLAVPGAAPSAPANAVALAVPIVAVAPNGEPWDFDLNEMPME